MAPHTTTPRPVGRRGARDGHTDRIGRHHHITARPRRLPPYSRTLRDRLAGDLGQWWGTSADGRRPSIWVAVGPGAWTWARERLDRMLVVVLPPGDDPSRYDWRIIKKHDPILMARVGDVSPAEVHALAAAMIRDGVDRVIDTDTGDLHAQEVAT